MRWCEAELKNIGYEFKSDQFEHLDDDGIRWHYRAYIELRACLREHVESDADPQLEMCRKPTAAWDWVPEGSLEHREPTRDEATMFYELDITGEE